MANRAGVVEIDLEPGLTAIGPKIAAFARSLEPLGLKVNLDSAAAQRGLNAISTSKPRAEINALEKVGASSLSRVGTAATAASGKMIAVGAAAGIAGAAVLKGLKGLADEFVSSGVEVIKLQRLIGGTAEEVSKLRFAAEATRVPFDSLVTGVTRLSANSKKLADIGVSLNDATGQARPFLEVFTDVAEKFRTAPAGIDKTAEAVALFGRGGTALLPLLNKGAAGIKELGDRAKELGLAFDDEKIAKVQAFRQAQLELGESVEGLKVSLGGEVLPLFKGLIDLVKSGTEAFVGLPAPVKSIVSGLAELAAAATIGGAAIAVTGIAIRSVGAGISTIRGLGGAAATTSTEVETLGGASSTAATDVGLLGDAAATTTAEVETLGGAAATTGGELEALSVGKAAVEMESAGKSVSFLTGGVGALGGKFGGLGAKVAVATVAFLGFKTAVDENNRGFDEAIDGMVFKGHELGVVFKENAKDAKDSASLTNDLFDILSKNKDIGPVSAFDKIFGTDEAGNRSAAQTAQIQAFGAALTSLPTDQAKAKLDEWRDHFIAAGRAPNDVRHALKPLYDLLADQTPFDTAGIGIDSTGDKLDEFGHKIDDTKGKFGQMVDSLQQEVAPAQGVVDAQLSVADATQSVADAQAEVDRIRSESVPGSDAEIKRAQDLAEAEQSVADAKRSVLSAQRELANANRDAADLEAELAHVNPTLDPNRYRDLSEKVRDAHDKQANAQDSLISANERVSQSEQDLADKRKAQATNTDDLAKAEGRLEGAKRALIKAQEDQFTAEAALADQAQKDPAAFAKIIDTIKHLGKMAGLTKDQIDGIVASFQAAEAAAAAAFPTFDLSNLEKASKTGSWVFPNLTPGSQGAAGGGGGTPAPATHSLTTAQLPPALVLRTEFGNAIPDGIQLDYQGHRWTHHAKGDRWTTFYAQGGIEDHQPQIAEPGTPQRIWNEPETGGEGYVPLAASKRPRAVKVWKEIGRRLGMPPVVIDAPISDPTLTAPALSGKSYVEPFANGGITHRPAADRVEPTVDAVSGAPTSTISAPVQRFARGGVTKAYSIFDHQLNQTEVFSAIKWFGTMMAKRLYLLKEAGLENAFDAPNTPAEVRTFDRQLTELGAKSPGIFHYAQVYAQSHPWTAAGPTPDVTVTPVAPQAESAPARHLTPTATVARVHRDRASLPVRGYQSWEQQVTRGLVAEYKAKGDWRNIEWQTDTRFLDSGETSPARFPGFADGGIVASTDAGVHRFAAGGIDEPHAAARPASSPTQFFSQLTQALDHHEHLNVTSTDADTLITNLTDANWYVQAQQDGSVFVSPPSTLPANGPLPTADNLPAQWFVMKPPGGINAAIPAAEVGTYPQIVKFSDGGIEGRESGGPVEPRSLYEIAESGKPEVVTVGARSYLVTGDQGGQVTAAQTHLQRAGGNATAAPPETTVATIDRPLPESGLLAEMQRNTAAVAVVAKGLDQLRVDIGNLERTVYAPTINAQPTDVGPSMDEAFRAANRHSWTNHGRTLTNA